ncbi:MAG: chromosome segregation protein SMC, partial [Nitrospirota bacterium]|nr:chromosome segregation protein SMC [Nitrospirota bacterium]
MRVERLELNGFKSFADRTVFKFHPGTTAIVGPNGCGKSNVVDAFKWVLGEQSAKSLRGGSMEDVIFAGSATKKTKGMAEVTLVLSDIIRPLDGSGNPETGMTEISVTRRLYRSGESEYLMNKVQCRLKDIKNLFLDTGLELKAYSILEQGRIGDIINSKPQDRRFLIEEVAGVMKYKVRKHEAMNKLEASKSNLLRIQDIISEVKRQINTIDRHAKKAEKYKKLFDELRDIELRIAKRDLKALVEDLSALASSEDSLKAREAETSANVHASEALIEEKKRLCIENERSLNGIRTDLYALEKETMEHEGKIALLRSDCANLGERQASLRGQDREREARKEEITVSIAEIVRSAELLGHEISAIEAVLEEKKAAFTESEGELMDMEHEIEGMRTALFDKAEEISNVRNEIGQISLSIDNISRKEEKNSRDITSIKDNITSLDSVLVQTRDEHARFVTELSETRRTAEELGSRLKDRKSDLIAGEEALNAEKVEFAAMGSRLEALKEQDSSQMGSLDDRIRRLCQVADIFETPAQYETAIEAILGDKLGAAVVEDSGAIRQALQYIREQNIKRSGFINVDSVRNIPFDGTALNGKEGVIGGASGFVSVKEGFGNIAASLLSDVVLVDSLNTAFSLREAHASDISVMSRYFVTLDGDVLEPSGMVFGGTDKGVLKIKRLIKELETGIAAKTENIEGLGKRVASLKEEIISIENEIISVNGKISSQEKFAHELEVKATSLEEENRRLLQKHEFISLEINDDTREKDGLQSALAEKELRAGELEAEKQRIEEEITSIRNRFSEKRESIEAMRSELTQFRMDLTSMKEKMASLKRESERLDAAILEIDRKRQEMLNEGRRIEEAIIEKENEILEKEGSLRSRIALVAELQSKASEMNEILESRNAELSLMEKHQKDLASELQTVRSELAHVEMKKMEQSMKLNYMKEDILKTYSIEIETAEVSDIVGAEEEAKLPQLREKIQEIGPVSLGTLDEYEELKTRHEFLTQQRDDLLASIQALEETITMINKTSQKRLQEAFDALNAKFKEVFMLLFGKGRAELQLTEGSIHEAGIEIIA